MSSTTITEELLAHWLGHFKDERVKSVSQPVWKACLDTGSSVWLDTGDMEAIDALTTPEVSAMTTNNTLLNKEVQKGIYDEVVRGSAARFEKLPERERIIEMAFLLNALHGSRLVKRYGGHVSVELHTDLAHDVEGIVHYGRRFHRINPHHFLVKVPFSAAGLIGARRLSDEGIPVNFTLLFSMRQNMLSALVARPAYTNVFLGRIGAYMSDNQLGKADGPGEKVVHCTQKCIRQLNSESKIKTRLIAASIRNFEQVPLLCGVDVLTIPAKVAADTVKQSKGPFRSMVDHDFNVVYLPGVVTSQLHMRKLWSVSDAEKRTFKEVGENVPASPDELVNHFRQQGLNDIFPELTDAQLQQISDDGKIPNHERWANDIRKGQTAIDTLLNLAGLASFASDQQALDERICEVAGWE